MTFMRGQAYNTLCSLAGPEEIRRPLSDIFCTGFGGEFHRIDPNMIQFHGFHVALLCVELHASFG